MSSITPKMTLGLIVLVLAINITIIVASVKMIIADTTNFVGYFLLGLIVLIDFAILTSIVQIQKPNYTKTSYY
ncbi:MAG: hypothetical protein ACFFDW_16420 [Candidatus Thorarchaeota archaeon]